MSSIKKLDGIVAQSSAEVSNKDGDVMTIPSLERFIEQVISGYHATNEPVEKFSTTIERYPFKPSVFDRWKMSHNLRYAAKAEARNYILQDISILGNRGTGEGLGAETVYRVIDSLPDRFFADARIAAGVGLLLGGAMSYLWINTVGDLGEASPSQYVDITIQATRRKAELIARYFQQRDPEYKGKFMQALDSFITIN